MKNITYTLILSVSLSLLLGCGDQEISKSNIKDGNIEQKELHDAVLDGDLKDIKSLAERGVPLDIFLADGKTPLLLALEKEDLKLFELLLQSGADPNFQIESGGSAMSFAVANKDSRFLKLALSFSGDPNFHHTGRKENIIFGAVSPGHLEHLEMLVDSGADVNVQDGVGNTPLVVAASLNQYRAAYYLLNNGAKADIKNRWDKGIIERIEQNNISTQTEAFQWRAKVISMLKEQGMEVAL